MRVDELVAGVKADVAVLIYGDDLQALSRLSKKVVDVLQKIPGHADVKADYQANLSTLRIEVDRVALARYGVDASVIMQTVESLGQLEWLKLCIITPIVLLMIGVLLYLTFNSFSLTILVFAAIPVAASGGVYALWFRGSNDNS